MIRETFPSVENNRAVVGNSRDEHALKEEEHSLRCHDVRISGDNDEIFALKEGVLWKVTVGLLKLHEKQIFELLEAKISDIMVRL